MEQFPLSGPQPWKKWTHPQRMHGVRRLNGQFTRYSRRGGGTRNNILVSFTIWECQRNPAVEPQVRREEEWQGSRAVRMRAPIHMSGMHTSSRISTGNDPVTWLMTLSGDLFDRALHVRRRRWEDVWSQGNKSKGAACSGGHYVSVREFLRARGPTPDCKRSACVQHHRGWAVLQETSQALREGWKILSSHSAILSKWMCTPWTKLWSRTALENL